MSITMHISPIEIQGKKVFTVRQFAAIIEKSDQTVLSLMHKGNRIRKLKFIKVAGKPYVLAEELTKFPFTCCGKGTDIYYYNKDGGIVYGDDR